MNKVYFGIQKCDLKKSISASAVGSVSDLTPNKVSDNYFVTLICNTSHVGCISDLYKVMRYIGKSCCLNFAEHLLEIGPTHGLLHIHCKAYVKNRSLLHKLNNSIYIRVAQRFPGYCLHFNKIATETHAENVNKYDKGESRLLVASNFIKTQYAKGTEWTRCPFHVFPSYDLFKHGECSDFTVNEAIDYYYLKHIRKNLLKF